MNFKLHKSHVAIIHDALMEFGGAERVLLDLLRLFPNAHIVTTAANQTVVDAFFSHIPKENIHMLFGHTTFFERHNSLFHMMSPFWWGKVNLRDYDIILSISAYKLANLVSTKSALHIQYVNSPPKNLFGLAPYTPLQHVIPYTKPLAAYYSKKIRESNYVIANSRHIQSVLFHLFGIHSDVIYPPVTVPITLPTRVKPRYYLCVSRIDDTKFLELPIRACSILKAPLKIVGATNNPSYLRKLKNIAGPTVEFLGFRTDKEIASLYTAAHAFLFPSKEEDFGIAPVEALAHGVPVIAFAGGGVRETIIDDVTGKLFFTHTTKALISAIKRFELSKFNPALLHRYAKTFGAGVFRKTMHAFIQNALTIRSNE